MLGFLKWMLVIAYIISSAQVAYKFTVLELGKKVWNFESVPQVGRVAGLILLLPAMAASQIIRGSRDFFVWALFKIDKTFSEAKETPASTESKSQSNP